MSSMRVLCVENEPGYMDVLRYMLESAGYEVTPAQTAGEALRLLASQHFDGVLLEDNLPDATGGSVRAEMKKLQPEVPVLLFAGVDDQTPLLLGFVDSYLRNSETPEWELHGLDA